MPSEETWVEVPLNPSDVRVPSSPGDLVGFPSSFFGGFCRADACSC